MRTATEFWFTLGSANLTRRNLEDFNLEANVAASVPLNADIATQISTWFDSLWNNRGPPELEYTAEFGAYADPSQGTLLALSPDGSHRPIYLLTRGCLAGVAAFHWRAAADAGASELVHRAPRSRSRMPPPPRSADLRWLPPSPAR